MGPLSMILCGIGLIMLAWTLALAWAVFHPVRQIRCLHCGTSHILRGPKAEQDRDTTAFTFVHAFCKRPAEMRHESDS